MTEPRQILLPGPPIRIQRRRAKGWRKPANTVYVGRPGPWGNPFLGDEAIADRAYVVRLFREHLARAEQADLVARIRQELAGKNLACWCPLDQPCHADVLLELANAPEKPA